MFWGVHRSLERSSDRLHEPGVFRRREVTVLGVWADWPTRRRVAVVPGHEVTVQMGNRISEQLVIRLVGLEEAIERLGASNAVLEEPGAFVLRQFVRFADMALADQHAAALDTLVAAEPQAAKVQVRDGMPILVGHIVGRDGLAERTVIAANQCVPALVWHPGRARTGQRRFSAARISSYCRLPFVDSAVIERVMGVASGT